MGLEHRLSDFSQGIPKNEEILSLKPAQGKLIV